MTDTAAPQPFNDFHQHTTACWWNHLEARRECPPPPPPHPAVAPTSGASADPERVQAQPIDAYDMVDVRDMIVVHTAMLREFRLAPAVVIRVPHGDRRAAHRVDDHLTLLCDLLHHHHAGEDELLWPPLRTRLSPAGQALLDEAEDQHAGLDSALDRVTAARARWVGLVDDDARCELIAALEALHGLLLEHLDTEERDLLPLAAAHLTPAEWAAVGAAGAAAVPKSKLLLVFGMFAYEGDPTVVRNMLHEAPPPARVVVKMLAPRIYRRYARRLHGTTQP